MRENKDKIVSSEKKENQQQNEVIKNDSECQEEQEKQTNKTCYPISNEIIFFIGINILLIQLLEFSLFEQNEFKLFVKSIGVIFTNSLAYFIIFQKYNSGNKKYLYFIGILCTFILIFLVIDANIRSRNTAAIINYLQNQIINELNQKIVFIEKQNEDILNKLSLLSDTISFLKK